MNVYTLTIQFRTGDKIDYSTIEGVYLLKGDAKEAAKKALNSQHALWEDARAYQVFKSNARVVVALERPSGISKRYIIEEHEAQ